MRSPTVRHRFLATFAALAVLAIPLAIPAAAAAHPLGNFTINHYAALRVGADHVDLDVVVDFAEIPTFQERLRIDANGDGDVTAAETDAARELECRDLVPSLSLVAGGVPLDLRLDGAGLAFPAGAGGVPTMRVVCELSASIDIEAGGIGGVTLTFADTSYEARIGWREIVVLGDAVTIGGTGTVPPPTSTDVSARLTTYPAALLTQPLNARSVAFTAASGGPPLVPFAAPDAAPLPGASPGPSPSIVGGGPAATPGSNATPAPAVVPGGVAGEIPALFSVAELTPFLAVASILLAMVLGAGHALTPGHGKTLMAAYLVGTRGTVRHAAGLGLAVTVSHTIGILALALLVTGAESVLPADVVVRTVPLIAALAFLVIGASMVFAEVRRRWALRPVPAIASTGATAHSHNHDHEDEPGHPRDHGHGDDHDHGHEPEHPGDHDEGDREQAAAAPGEHSHGGLRHSHLPADDRTLSWKRLFALGLAGGIIPSTNALIILLGTIVAGRAAFGVVLVVAFGLGMALVLGGVGAAMVLARERMSRLSSGTRLNRLAAQAPLIASLAVLGLGLWLTAQAIGGNPVL
ncbi:MAG: hypothetical protein ABIV26_03265 [Candidatus Limnocylindrales bacterium]